MKNTARYLTVLCLIALALTTCGKVTGNTSGSEDTSKTPGLEGTSNTAALAGSKWMLLSYGTPGSPQAVMNGTKITLEFDAEGGVSGSAGCNTYFGSYEVKGETLSVGGIGITEMYCMSPEGVMEQETAYAELLPSAGRFEIQDGQLRITGAGGQILVFNATAAGR